MTSETLFSATNPTPINPSQGIESLTDLGGGAFRLTLGANNGGVPTYDAYTRLLNVSASEVIAAGGPPALGLLSLIVTADNVAATSGNPSLTVTPLVVDFGAGVLPNVLPGLLPDGTTLLVEITLSNTSAY